MPIDLYNEARNEKQELIPSGIYWVQAEIVPGGYGDGDILKQSKKGTLAYLNLRAHVLEGPYRGCSIYDMIMVEPIGNNPTDGEQQSVRNGRARVRRMVESARGVDVGHEAPETIRDRLAISGWGDVHGLVYFARVGVEEANNGHKEKNIIEQVITPCDNEWPGTPTTPAAPMRAIVIASSNTNTDDEIPF
jgi:hypothetical protein